ncbi:MAG: hypothetical protein MZU91_02715 [Desulfosudis oleivorans]|nr:hypothetical protein [Desulfosudis oleivorans]
MRLGVSPEVVVRGIRPAGGHPTDGRAAVQGDAGARDILEATLVRLMLSDGRAVDRHQGRAGCTMEIPEQGRTRGCSIISCRAW